MPPVDTQAPITFNPLEPGYLDDPYSQLAAVRSGNPVHELFDRWGLFRYEDCFKLLRDPSLSVEETNSDILETDRADQFRAELQAQGLELERDRSMLGLDPPDHTRLRKLVTKAFTPRTIETLRDRVQEMVDEKLDAMAAAGRADVVSELAFPLPFDVINEMLGLPDTDKAMINEWSGAMVKTLDPIVSPEDIKASVQGQIHMDAHIEKVIAWKRENPADDLLTRMIEAEEDGDRLTTRELVAQVTLLFIAGHETTVNLIGAGLFELLRNPEQLALWRDDDGLDANAVDELLRFVSPVQMSRRITTAKIEFTGTPIPHRAFVLAMLASANRDPEKFGATADRLDLMRADAGQHLSFGSGSHYCLGASLAKMEAQVAIGSFIRRFPNARPDGDHVWNGRLNLRGLESLPLALS